MSHCFSRETYNALTNWLTDARTLASPNIVIVLVGNKKDLEAEREVTFLEASRFAIENGEFKRRASGHSAVCVSTWLQTVVDIFVILTNGSSAAYLLRFVDSLFALCVCPCVGVGQCQESDGPQKWPPQRSLERLCTHKTLPIS